MKAVRGLSIGFRTLDRDFADDGTRLIKEVELWEVSIVSLAMNPMAKVDSAKARLSLAGEYVPTEREFEQSLRDAGYSKRVARQLCAKVFDSADGGMLDDESRWDAGDIDEDEAFAKFRADQDAMLGRTYARMLSR
jgi:hypothetical protein